jgi:hypothetical protein
MTSTNGEEVLKEDTRGRVRVPPDRREALLDEFERSGLSGARFARMAGVKYPTLANWLQKRRKAREQSAEPTGPSIGEAAMTKGPVRLFEAVVGEGVGRPVSRMSETGLMIELPGGGRMRVESPIELRLAAELLGLMAANIRIGC